MIRVTREVTREYTIESSRFFLESIRSFDWNWTILKLKVYDNFADDLFKYTASQKIETSEERIFEQIVCKIIVNFQFEDRSVSVKRSYTFWKSSWTFSSILSHDLELHVSPESSRSFIAPDRNCRIKTVRKNKSLASARKWGNE